MIEITVKEADSRQRSDKFICKLLPGASKSLLYKQMRKKNITLNGKKMTGAEIISSGDTMQFFFSDETFKKFSQPEDKTSIITLIQMSRNAYEKYPDIKPVYEDDNIISINKPDNLLSQMADNNELSLNEWLIGYLLATDSITEDSLYHFKPSVLNRLDKNTSGMVLGSKTLLGANVVSELLRDRSLEKYYLTVVAGSFSEDGIYKAYHYKDEANNKVSISASKEEAIVPAKASEIITGVRKVAEYTNDLIGSYTLLEIELITGKSHQIRAHLAYLGYPVLGDYKYGNSILNSKLKGFGIDHQMLHSYKMKMPDKLPPEISALSGKEILCNPPECWRKLNVDLENARS